MSASENTNSLVGSGEFSSKVPPSEPLTTHGHKPGVMVGNDAKPEFSAETLPAGSAPAESTFQPDADPDLAVPPGGYNASDSIGGAMSGDLSGGGNPIQDQTSNESSNNAESQGKTTG